MKRSLYYPFHVPRINRRFVILLFYVFVLFSFWGQDWFHYRNIYPQLLNGEKEHMETIYIHIAQYLSFNYTSFRLVIWGSAIYLFLKMIKSLHINNDIAFFVFGSIWLIWFSYARASLAMILAYFGMTVLMMPSKRKFISVVSGLIVLFSSVFFHKSAAFALILILLTFLSNYLNRKVFIFCMCVSMVLAYIYLPSFIADFMTLDASESDTNLILAGQGYMSNDDSAMGIAAMLLRFFEVLPYYILAFVSLKLISKNNKYNLPNDIVIFSRLLLFIVIASSFFMMNLSVNTSVIYMRFLRFAAIPSVVVLSYLLENKIFYKLSKAALMLGIFSTMSTLLYALYNTIV